MIRVVFCRPRWIVAASLLGAVFVAPLVSPRVAWADSFKLGPDDVIAVQVANHLEMSAPEISVGANGKIPLPLVGNLTVSGLTLAQAQIAVTNALKKQLRAPQVTVTLVRSKPRQVLALGAVTRPGPVDVLPGWRVSEVLAAVGGLAMPIDFVTATLAHGKDKPQPLDLAKIVDSPDSKANLPVTTNDQINVVAVPVSNVTVGGDVIAPGKVILRHDPKVMDAILASGNLKGKPEEMTGTLLRGADTKIPLDLPAIFRDRSSAANAPLKDGDMLSFNIVQTNVTVFSVDNLVKTPGAYQLGTDATAVGALVKAGGLTVTPDNVVATVRRGAQSLPINLARAVYDPTQDIPLQNNDVLLVAYPDGPQVTFTGAVARPGPLRVKTGTTLLDGIVTAGGLTFKPDQIRMSVLRTVPGGKQVSLAIDPVALFDLRDLGQNLILQQGDLVIINEGIVTQTVFVSGEVATPGAFEMDPKDGIPEVILKAGGPTKRAALTKVSVTHRDHTVQTMDISPSLEPNAPKLDFPLQPGDIVVVPANENKVLVTNAVMNPGYYPIPEKGTLTLGDAILAAGGSKVNAKLKQVIVLRRTPVGIEKNEISLDEIKNGVLNQDMPLRTGDVVYVPAGRTGPSALSEGTRTLGSIVGLLRLGTLF